MQQLCQIKYNKEINVKIYINSRLIEKHGIYPEAVTSCGMASMLIEKLKNRQIEGLATPKQIRLLERYGFLHVGMWPFESASKMVSRLAENKWLLPRGVNVTSYQP